MRDYPQFCVWILIALAKICFFHSHKSRINMVVLVGKFLKKPEYPKIRTKNAQLQKEASSLIKTNITHVLYVIVHSKHC